MVVNTISWVHASEIPDHLPSFLHQLHQKKIQMTEDRKTGNGECIEARMNFDRVDVNLAFP